MFIKGNVVGELEIKVDEFEVLNELSNSLILKIEKCQVPKDAYINSKGYWETWDQGRHGSGDYEIYRKATKKEIENNSILNNFSENDIEEAQNLIKKLKSIFKDLDLKRKGSFLD